MPGSDIHGLPAQPISGTTDDQHRNGDKTKRERRQVRIAGATLP